MTDASSECRSLLAWDDTLFLRVKSFRGDHQLGVGEMERSDRLCFSVRIGTCEVVGR